MADKSGQTPSSIRIHNRKRVMDIIRREKSCTASEIARELKLSKTTIWKIIDYLLNDGLVLNIGKDMSLEDRGKKPERYSLNRNYGYIIGTTIYSDCILSALCDTGGTIFYKEKQFISPNADLNEVIPVISGFIEKWQTPDGETVEKDSRLLGIVIASTGVTNTEEGICLTAAKFNSWPSDTPLKELIEERVTLKAPFYIDNYNRYSAFAEKHLGGLNEYQNIVNIVTGKDELGSGVIIDGRLRRGKNYLSGEIGHMIVNPEWKESCHCGGTGCFEQMISVDRMLSRASDEKKSHPDSPIYRSGTPASLSSIMTAADNGDPWCRELLNDVIRWFAIGIQNTVLLFDPDIIILSGIYNQGSPYFIQCLKDKVRRLSLNRMEKKIEIRYSLLENDAPLLGAIRYVIEDYFSDEKNY